VTYNPIWSTSSDYQLECHCGVTYVKFMVRGLGVEVRPNVNASLTCDNTCGNPWPAPAPTGYSCSQNLVT
jgi:hypothetical protein